MLKFCQTTFQINASDFLKRFKTTNKTWVTLYKTKKQSMQWKNNGSPPSKGAESVFSAGKVRKVKLLQANTTQICRPH